jgi:hypothetical protein
MIGIFLDLREVILARLAVVSVAKREGETANGSRSVGLDKAKVMWMSAACLELRLHNPSLGLDNHQWVPLQFSVILSAF